MCYLRNFTPIQKTPILKDQISPESPQDYHSSNAPSQEFHFGFDFLRNEQILAQQNFTSNLFASLMQSVQKNTVTIDKICEKISENDFLLEEIEEEGNFPNPGSNLKQAGSETDESSMEDRNTFKSEQLLTKKLFGENKEYKYKLNLDGGFPQQIFKQRNFSFNLSLTDSKGNKIRNSNIIHLCLAVCDANGEWVTETKAKEPFMKGKTEAELYHGESSYTKIYSRDVSRFYREGKLNLVVYPKESALKYFQGSTGLEEVVSFQEIEPLVIKDLTIKAKKKQ